MNTTTDFHQTGVFAVKDPDGNILFDTFASTAYSARASFGRLHNKKWSAAVPMGYSMFGYAESVQVLTEPRAVSDDTPTDAENRIAELEAIEQPLDVVEAGDGGDFGQAQYDELHRLRQARDAAVDEDLDLDIPRSADEWDMYEGLAGAEEAAQALGAKLEELLLAALATGNTNMDSARRIRDLMYVEMAKYTELGAGDTEPQTILVSRIEAALGLDDELMR